MALNHKTGIRVLLCGAVGAIMAASPAAADGVEEFYARKQTIIMLTGTRPGGSYGLYGGIIGKYVSEYIPGKPKIVMNYMPGAGGAKAANYLYGAAPKGGGYMLLTHAIPIIEKLIGEAFGSRRAR